MSERAAAAAQAALWEKEGPAYAAVFVAVLRNASRDEPTAYVLALLDEALLGAARPGPARRPAAVTPAARRTAQRRGVTARGGGGR